MINLRYTPDKPVIKFVGAAVISFAADLKLAKVKEWV